MMRILYEEAGVTRLFRLPLALLRTPVGALLVSSGVKALPSGSGRPAALTTYRQARSVARALYHSRHILGSEPLVDFQMADGSRLRVFL